jgi:hypothetical protein
MCSRCRRSGTVKVTINLGDRRWRLCANCAGRADKTTIVQPVACAHPFARAAYTDGSITGYLCRECFQFICLDCAKLTAVTPDSVPGDRCQCVPTTAEAGHAGLSLVVPVAIFGSALVALAGVSGNLGYLWHHLPLTPTPNGFTLLALTALTVGWWWRLTRIPDAPHELDVLLDLDDPLCLDDPGRQPQVRNSPIRPRRGRGELMSTRADRRAAAMRAEIARMITRERTAAQVCAHPVGDRHALADRAEAAFRTQNPRLAEFHDLAKPEPRAKR